MAKITLHSVKTLYDDGIESINVVGALPQSIQVRPKSIEIELSYSATGIKGWNEDLEEQLKKYLEKFFDTFYDKEYLREY